MNSKFCTYCGKAINPNAKFCTKCGNLIISTVKQSCSNCGNKISSLAKFCIKCGSKIRQPKPKRTPKIIPIFVIFILIAGSYYYLNNNDQNQFSTNQDSSISLKAQPPSKPALVQPYIAPSKPSLNVQQLAEIELLNSEMEKVYVSRIIDGDTIELKDGRKIRYIGIETPETVHPDRPIECFGPEASAKNKELVFRKNVYIYKGNTDLLSYNRYLRYVVTEDGLFVNDLLVKQGYAKAPHWYYDHNLPNVFELLKESELIAKESKSGLWGMCNE